MYGRVFIHFWCHISVANVRMAEDTYIYLLLDREIAMLCYAMLCSDEETEISKICFIIRAYLTTTMKIVDRLNTFNAVLSFYIK